jgi:hypothetical protein
MPVKVHGRPRTDDAYSHFGRNSLIGQGAIESTFQFLQAIISPSGKNVQGAWLFIHSSGLINLPPL